DDAAIATGRSPYDALAGSVLQGKIGSVLLLADQNNTHATDMLAEKSITTYKYFGGSALFNNVFKVQLAYEMKFPLYEIEGLVIYLDAGHGWDSSNNNVFDWGASGNGYREFGLTKELANKVAAVLRDTYQVAVYVNDDGGYYAYRQAEAYAMNAGVLVSIHFNSDGGVGTARGTESYIHSYNAAPGSDTLQRKTHNALVSGLGLPDRGMKDEEFAVCGGKVPGVLLEIAFITSGYDMDVYSSRKDAAAGKIAQGIAA
ncbi:MAG: N-acetylmuramoyl-L-alanine amidase, partial [Raoultibacter sp.]